MRVVVLGATGNVGTSLLQALTGDDRIDAVIGAARRLPNLSMPKVEWARADIATSDLTTLFRGADAIVHLAWLIQPSRDLDRLRRVNVDGSARVFRAAAEAGVPALVYASSLGVYSPGPKDRRVDESWPVEGIRTSFYSRHKAEVERMLDRFEEEHPHIRVVRLRPGLIFKREAATGIRRLFVGPFLPSKLLRPGLLPVVPDVPGLRAQAVHSLDVGEAYRLAIVGDARGAFNIIADPPLDAEVVAHLLNARPIQVSRAVLRGAFSMSYHLRLQPSPPGWLDLGLAVPLLDATRAHDELGWRPKRTAADALLELIAGLTTQPGSRRRRSTRQRADLDGCGNWQPASAAANVEPPSPWRDCRADGARLDVYELKPAGESAPQPVARTCGADSLIRVRSHFPRVSASS